jgi:hypothetical protein
MKILTKEIYLLMQRIGISDTKIDKESRKTFNHSMMKYYNHQQETKKILSEELCSLYDLHDCVIKKIDIENNSLKLSIDSFNTYSHIVQIDFQEVSNHDLSLDMEHKYILYVELYYNQSQYEIQLLIDMNNEEKAKEVCIICSNILITHRKQ